MNARMLIAVAALLVLPAAAEGEIDQAKELGKFLGRHGYGAMPTDNGNDNSQEVEARINGKGVYLTVDTGCDRTCISARCARHLHLDVHDTGEHDWGAGGEINGTVGAAIVASMTLNNYEINRTNIIRVLPKGAHTGRDDGLFGLDFLKLNAVILPVGARFFLYKPGNGAVPPIESYMKAMNFRAIPLRYVKGGLRIDGTLNGQAFNALVDCGASYSVFDYDYVRKVNGGQVFSERWTMEGVDGIRQSCNRFIPKNLVLGGAPLSETESMTTSSPSFSHEGFNALFGYDLLASHQAIIDLGHNVLWMK